MAKATPEGKVKKKLIEFLKSLGSDCFYYMPVQNGMGQTGIPDVMAIIHRVPLSFECKATPKQHPTVLQAYALDRIHKAGGFAWVVDNESIDLALDVLKKGIEYHLDFPRNAAKQICKQSWIKPLYRWKDKLEVMEFEDGTCSQG